MGERQDSNMINKICGCTAVNQALCSSKLSFLEVSHDCDVVASSLERLPPSHGRDQQSQGWIWHLAKALHSVRKASCKACWDDEQ